MSKRRARWNWEATCWKERRSSVLRRRTLKTFALLFSSGVAITLFTGAMAVTTYLQWQVMQVQTSQTDAVIEQMRLEQRAWLGVQATPTLDVFTVGQQVRYTVPIRNTGRTPGTIESIASSIVIRPPGEDIESRFNNIDVEYRQMAVAPDGTVRFPAEINQSMPQAVFDAIMSGTQVLYVVGIVIYADVLGRERRTRFCFEYDPESKQLVAHERYNDMT